MMSEIPSIDARLARVETQLSFAAAGLASQGVKFDELTAGVGRLAQAVSEQTHAHRMEIQSATMRAERLAEVDAALTVRVERFEGALAERVDHVEAEATRRAAELHRRADDLAGRLSAVEATPRHAPVWATADGRRVAYATLGASAVIALSLAGAVTSSTVDAVVRAGAAYALRVDVPAGPPPVVVPVPVPVPVPALRTLPDQGGPHDP